MAEARRECLRAAVMGGGASNQIATRLLYLKSRSPDGGVSFVSGRDGAVCPQRPSSADDIASDGTDAWREA
jgi:hypothetical protein